MKIPKYVKSQNWLWDYILTLHLHNSKSTLTTTGSFRYAGYINGVHVLSDIKTDNTQHVYKWRVLWKWPRNSSKFLSDNTQHVHNMKSSVKLTYKLLQISLSYTPRRLLKHHLKAQSSLTLWYQIGVNELCLWYDMKS